MWLLQMRRKHSCWKKKHHMLKNVAKFICLECTKNLNRDLIHFKTKTICMLLFISFINNFWSIIFELPHIIWSLFIYYCIVTYFNFSRLSCILRVLWIIPLYAFCFLFFCCLWGCYCFWDRIMTKTWRLERNISKD